jgi:hypothetical protein
MRSQLVKNVDVIVIKGIGEMLLEEVGEAKASLILKNSHKGIITLLMINN